MALCSANGFSLSREKPDKLTVSSCPASDGTAFAELIPSKLWGDGLKLPVWFFIWGLLAAPAVADHPVSVNKHGFVAFSLIDSDHSGYVSRAEARSVGAVEAVFESADINRDGLLNRNEYTSIRSTREANPS